MCNKSFTLITGASEGFGKALALECARRNMNLVLVALPGSGLQNLATYIEKNFGVTVVCIEKNLCDSESCYQVFDAIKEKGIPVNMLINNAGMGGTHYFDERSAEFYRCQIELNVTAPTLLTHLFLNTLEHNTPSWILNVSSLAGLFSLPLKQVYGGTKSYLVSFSKSLRRELKSKNVYVSVICPGGMNTTLKLVLQHRMHTGISRWSVMNPDKVARIAIDGMLNKKEMIIPGFWNKIFLMLDKLFPNWLKELITEKQMETGRITNNITPSINNLKTAV
jgi:short-subunit dehydrogenase